MVTSFLTLALTVLASSPVADTTLSVEQGDRLVVQGFSGEIAIEAWNGSQVLIEAGGSDRVEFDLRSEGGSHVLRPADRKGRDRFLEYRLRLPAWLALEVRGQELDVRVEGHGGNIDVRTLQGDIVLTDVAGEVRARTVDGEIVVSGADGSLELFSLDDDIRIEGVRGTVRIEGNDGNIRLTDVDASSVEATTVDGDIVFSGALRPGGSYSLVTHDGDVTFSPYGALDARFVVSTFAGGFETELPVRIRNMSGGGALEFELGTGSADVRLEAFDGSVRLERSSGRNPR